MTRASILTSSPHDMTIYQLKALNEQNGGRFFSRENMKFFGDTIRNFGMCKGRDANTVTVYRKRTGKPNVPLTVWTFDLKTGRVVHN
jgi:hypothetical protein